MKEPIDDCRVVARRRSVHRTIVCLITHMSGPGGAQKATMRLARELRLRGHVVEVWPLYTGAPLELYSHVQVLMDVEKPGPLERCLIYWRLIRKLRSLRPDAVVSFLPLACVMGQTAALLAGVRCRIASQRNPGWSYHNIMQACDKLAGTLGAYTCNVANSYAVRDSFASYPLDYRNRLVVIYNGVELRPSALQQVEARRKFNLPAEAPLLVAVGRLSLQKNYSLLVEVLSGLPHVHLAIGGGGELQDSIRQQATSLCVSERLHLLGKVNPTDIPDLLRAGDIFVHPSLYEGQSNALLEAMCAGLPILASNIPPQVETLTLGKGDLAGWLLPPDDANAWRRAVTELIHNRDARQNLSGRAKERAADFCWERMADGFENIIERCFDVSNG